MARILLHSKGKGTGKRWKSNKGTFRIDGDFGADASWRFRGGHRGVDDDGAAGMGNHAGDAAVIPAQASAAPKTIATIRAGRHVKRNRIELPFREIIRP